MRHEQLSVNELTVRRIKPDDGSFQTKRKIMETVGGTIEYDAADPFTVLLGTIPAGAVLVELIADIETVFNAATTNVLVVGNSTTADAYAADGDIDEASATLQRVAQNRAVLTEDTKVYAKYTQTGTAATTGIGHISLVYESPRT